MPQDAKDIQFAELKDMISQLNNTVSVLHATIASQSEMLGQKDAAIAKLTEEVSYLRKKLFGASSEKRPDIDPNQFSLFDVEERTEIGRASWRERVSTRV